MTKYDGQSLAVFCQNAFNSYRNSCSHSVWYVVKKYRPEQPYMTANSLIDYLSNNPDWQEVDIKETAQLASEGILVVGGLKGNENGHVVVVYPGQEIPRGGYYFRGRNMAESEYMPRKGLFPRVMSTSMGDFPGATSNGDKTVWDPWGSKTKIKMVKFWKYVGKDQASSFASTSYERWDVGEKREINGLPLKKTEGRLEIRGPSNRWRLEADPSHVGKPENVIRWQR
jgi:hypothetical protein